MGMLRLFMDPQIKSAHSGYQDRDYEFPAEKNKNVIGWTKLAEFFLGNSWVHWG